jgi:hypothetical protein
MIEIRLPDEVARHLLLALGEGLGKKKGGDELARKMLEAMGGKARFTINGTEVGYAKGLPGDDYVEVDEPEHCPEADHACHEYRDGKCQQLVGQAEIDPYHVLVRPRSCPLVEKETATPDCATCEHRGEFDTCKHAKGHMWGIAPFVQNVGKPGSHPLRPYWCPLIERKKS